MEKVISIEGMACMHCVNHVQQALSAVGACASLTVLFTALAIGFSIGAGVLISQYFSASRERELRQYAATAIVLMLAMGLFMSVIGVVSARFLLERALGTPEALLPLTLLYFRIYAAGLVFQFGYNIVAALLRALGDSKATLYFLLVSSVINLVLDLLFVVGFRWGVAGAAIATVLSQVGSAVVSVIYMFRKYPLFRFGRGEFVFLKDKCLLCLRLGVPTTIQQSIVSFGNVFIQRLVNSFGPAVMAAFTVGSRIENYLFVPAIGFNIGLANFTGQNIGAGRLDRVEKGTKDGLKLGLSVSVVLVALILFFGRYLMEMFTSTPEVIDTGMHMMRILAIGYIAMAVTQILSGIMRGAGDTMTPMWISLITTVVIRVPIAYGLAALMHSADALFISLLTSWVMGAVLTSIAFRMGRWKKKSIINDDVPEPADVQV